MQLTLSGHHIELTDSLRNYVNEKFAKVARHFDHVLDVHVILTVEKLQQKAEATLNISGGNIFAEDTKEDMYAAIDGLIEKLDRQVIKHKEKIKNHHRNNNEGSHRNFDAAAG
ncbi:MAG: ribosome hibernation-promoting factor, HPF/YfiA family [bacterium]